MLVKVGQIIFPTNKLGEIWIYYSGPRPGRTISVSEILEADEAQLQNMQNAVAGKIVLIGISTPSLLDIRAMPLSSSTAGVEVHAEALKQIMANQYLTRPDYATGAERFAMIRAALAPIILMPKVGPAWCAVLGGIIVICTVGGSWYSFSQKGFLFDPVYPMLGSTAVCLAVSGMLFLTAERERRSVRRAFSQYLSPEMVEWLADDPDALQLGDEDKELTALMNGFLTSMSDILMERGATINKYIGDAIMAFWNAPLGIEDHPAKACAAALAMVNGLEQVRHDTGHDINIGIGLNTGECTVGNF